MITRISVVALASAACGMPGGYGGHALYSFGSTRYSAPRSPIYHADQVVFGRAVTGGWRIVRYEGQERERALAWWRSGQPMPDGIFALVARSDGGYDFVRPEDVAWFAPESRSAVPAR